MLDFGPVFLPDKADSLAERPLIRAASARSSTLSATPLPRVALCSFGLSTLTEQELSQQLTALHAEAEYAVFLDFKVAERNIELPACALLAPFRRMTCRRDSLFPTLSGLEGLLFRERSRFAPLQRYTLGGGGLICILTQCRR